MNELTFVVEADSLSQFVEVVNENDLKNEIIGQSEDNHYFIDVEYEDYQEDVIAELMEFGELADDDDDELEGMETECGI